jgi:hypothetical protein
LTTPAKPRVVGLRLAGLGPVVVGEGRT